MEHEDRTDPLPGIKSCARYRPPQNFAGVVTLKRFTVLSLVNGHISIRTGPWSAGGRWADGVDGPLTWGTEGTRMHYG